MIKTVLVTSISMATTVASFIFSSFSFANKSRLASPISSPSMRSQLPFIMGNIDPFPLEANPVRRSARLSQKRNSSYEKKSPTGISLGGGEKTMNTPSANTSFPVSRKKRTVQCGVSDISEPSGSSQGQVKRIRRKTDPSKIRNVTPDTSEKSSSIVDTRKSGENKDCNGKCLPRTREIQIQASHHGVHPLTVIGVDEAGRGPLAGPVVAAAAIVPEDIFGVIDSKKITKESEREKLYEEIVNSAGVRYAVAVVSAKRIDEINILQATLEGMRMAVEALVCGEFSPSEEKGDKNMEINVASAKRDDLSYVVTGGDSIKKAVCNDNKKSTNFRALIDGNKIPKDMPCPSECLIKGDGREYCIGAASILAKVTRDRILNEYSKLYPEYNLSQHKGYPTAAHMSAVRKFGASPIHRRTFAPLKHMEFDEDGKIL